MTHSLTRRAALAGGAAIAAQPVIALANNPAPQINSDLLDVIHELEAIQGWEASGVVAARAYAAYRIRSALGMETPCTKYAQMHIDYQKDSFSNYQRTLFFERDQLAGINYPAPRGAL